MKILGKFNLVLFPYCLMMLAFFLLQKGYWLIGALVLIMSFLGWLVSAGIFFQELKKLEDER